ncbi:MAG TPA: polysaccharide deacetylase family protein [Bacteroidia bacterium]|nr:polysaccharide deacetylase family protein [Bacteroidia bacterium]
MLLIQPRRFLRKIYPKAIWHYNRDEKNIYLSFDDGPIPDVTEWVLDELGKHHVNATFFCVGANVLKHHAIYRRILEEGHVAANHSMFHTRGFSAGTEAYVQEVEACKKLIGNSIFRPPYGQMKRGQYKTLKAKGYKIVMWDVISYDYEKIEAERVLQNVKQYSKPGSIIVFHDSLKAEKNLRYVLPKTLEFFLEQGFAFKTID